MAKGTGKVRAGFYVEKKYFYTGNVPKKAVKSAVFGTFWCLGGV